LMRLDITGRHVEITASLRQLIARRLAKLERLLNDSAISAQVILTTEKYRHGTEIIIHARGDHILRGQGEGTLWTVSVREAAAKIEQQAQKLKGKWGERSRVARRGSCARHGMPSSRCRSRMLRFELNHVPMCSSCFATPRPTR
jgi:putative sigma-54 modulation protein